MAELLVRDVSDEMVRRLERQAAAHGRSVEAELRAILEQAVGPVPLPPAEHSVERWLESLQAVEWLGDLDPRELRDGPEAGRVTYVPAEGLDRLERLMRGR